METMQIFNDISGSLLIIQFHLDVIYGYLASPYPSLSQEQIKEIKDISDVTNPAAVDVLDKLILLNWQVGIKVMRKYVDALEYLASGLGDGVGRIDESGYSHLYALMITSNWRFMKVINRHIRNMHRDGAIGNPIESMELRSLLSHFDSPFCLALMACRAYLAYSGVTIARSASASPSPASNSMAFDSLDV